MQKDGKTAAEIAKLMKLDVKTVKSILGEEVCPKCDGEGCEHCNNTGYHKEETLHEFKKMTVTFKDMEDMKKASKLSTACVPISSLVECDALPI